MRNPNPITERDRSFRDLLRQRLIGRNILPLYVSLLLTGCLTEFYGPQPTSLVVQTAGDLDFSGVQSAISKITDISIESTLHYEGVGAVHFVIEVKRDKVGANISYSKSSRATTPTPGKLYINAMASLPYPKDATEREFSLIRDLYRALRERYPLLAEPRTVHADKGNRTLE